MSEHAIDERQLEAEAKQFRDEIGRIQTEIDCTSLAKDRTLDVRETAAFTQVAHEVRQALHVGHTYDED